jgi:uncharacterized protein (TIGR02996 family)
MGARDHPDGVFITRDATLDGLLGAVKAAPADGASWLVLADRLEELGRPNLAAVLRLSEAHNVTRVWQECGADAPTPEGRARCEDVRWHAKYAEPGYTTPEAGICLGNWNTAERHTAGAGYRDVDDTPKLLGDLLEALGVECEWSDEWDTCDECGGLVRTCANCFDWTPHYRADDDTELPICLNCVGEDDDEDGPGRCPHCGDVMDTDCQGSPRCPDCDGPCPCCSDGN